MESVQVGCQFLFWLAIIFVEDVIQRVNVAVCVNCNHVVAHMILVFLPSRVYMNILIVALCRICLEEHKPCCRAHLSDGGLVDDEFLPLSNGLHYVGCHTIIVSKYVDVTSLYQDGIRLVCDACHRMLYSADESLCHLTEARPQDGHSLSCSLVHLVGFR